MRSRTSTRRTAAASRGTVLVVVALMLPVLIGFAGLVVDVGNWFVHSRHLQMQADASVFAGAGEFTAFTPASCDDGAITARARGYSGASGATYNAQIGGTSPADIALDMTLSPCAEMQLDVKLTEKDLPWLLDVTKVVPAISAAARVKVLQETASVGALPVAVGQAEPNAARAEFVDEATNTVIASTPLDRSGSAGGLTSWTSPADVPVAINGSHIGVRIALGGRTSTTCGDPLVQCYDGVALIRGFSTAAVGAGDPPVARDVEYASGSCEDGYFTSTAPDPCTVTVTARVDIGSADLATTRLYVKRAGADDATKIPLTPPATPGGAWTDGSFAVPAGSGQVGGVLLYRLHCPADLALSCAKPLDAVADSGHRIFAASAAGSGPVKSVRVLESMSPGANSFARGSTPSLSVAITTQGKLRNAASAGDARVTLQVAGHGTLDCGPGTFDAEVLDGCPSITAGDSRPTDAAATSGELTEGLNHRILGAPSPSTCTAVNHWSAFPGLPKGDPRIVELPVAPFGALGAGTTSVPISGFSAFYITGWGGSANPCQSGTDDPAADGEIVGHFIKYIDTLNDGGTGDVPCDFDAFGRCVAVLTG